MIAMVSSMRFLPLARRSPTREGGSRALNCNLGAALLSMCVAASAYADQPAAAPTAQPNEHRAADTVKFLAGGLTGLVVHEAGHLVFDVAFDADPRVAGIRFGAVPFVAIEHRSDLPPRRELIISSAGFWMQEAGNEWLLTRRRSLRAEHAPFAKGVL